MCAATHVCSYVRTENLLGIWRSGESRRPLEEQMNGAVSKSRVASRPVAWLALLYATIASLGCSLDDLASLSEGKPPDGGTKTTATGAGGATGSGGSDGTGGSGSMSNGGAAGWSGIGGTGGAGASARDGAAEASVRDAIQTDEQHIDVSPDDAADGELTDVSPDRTTPYPDAWTDPTSPIADASTDGGPDADASEAGTEAGPPTGVAYRIVAEHSGKCADVYHNLTADGTAIDQYVCNGTTAQTFELRAVNAGYSFVGTNSDKCIATVNGAGADGTTLEIRPCDGSVAQLFTLSLARADAYAIVHTASGKCVEVKNSGKSDGAVIQLLTCSGQDNQLWTFQ